LAGQGAGAIDIMLSDGGYQKLGWLLSLAMAVKIVLVFLGKLLRDLL